MKFSLPFKHNEDKCGNCLQIKMNKLLYDYCKILDKRIDVVNEIIGLKKAMEESK